MQSTIIVLVLCTFFTVFAQEQDPISFRSQALGGVIKDDLDLIYDPVELRFVQGLRFYTNLSNLTSGQEEFLNNISDNEYLLGTSLKFPFQFDLWASFLIRFQDTELSNDVAIDSDLDGIVDIFSEGRFLNIYTGFFDTNGDGLYDIKNSISQDKSNFSRSKHQGYIFNTATILSDWTIGLKFTTGKQKRNNTIASYPLGSGIGQLMGVVPGDPSFALDYNRTQIRFSFNDFLWTENGNFENENENALTSIRLGLMKPFSLPVTDTVEIRADFGFKRENQVWKIYDTYQGSTQYFDRMIVNSQDSYQENDGILNETDTKGNHWIAGISLRKILQKRPERKNDDYWKLGLGIEYAQLDYRAKDLSTFISKEYFFDGTDTLLVDYSDEQESFYEFLDVGDLNSTRFFINALINFHLGKPIYAGAGFFYSFTNQNRPTDFTESYNKYQNYERFGGTGLEDFQRWEKSLLTANRKIDQDIINFSFPVGIEYKFTKNEKWSLRFGSIYNYVKITENETKEITGSEPLKITTVDGLGNEFVTIDDNVFESSSSHKKTSESNTTFYYGLGFDPNNHLQIDLLGFLGNQQNLQIFDAEFIRSLRISFTVKL